MQFYNPFSGGRSESNLPDSDSVCGTNSGTDSGVDSGIDSGADSGIDYGAYSVADSGPILKHIPELTP